MRKLTLFLFLSVLLFSCDDEVCDNLDCGPNGTCNEDTETCICDDFYEGTNCELETRARFIGTYNTSNSNCVDQDGEILLPTWTIEPTAEINGIRVQGGAAILSNTFLDATLVSDNMAVITPIVLGTLNVSGTITFVNENALSLSLTTNVTCDFDLFN